MLSNKYIAVVVAVDWNSIENVQRLSKSLQKHLPGYEIDIQALAYNAPMAFDEGHVCPSFNIFDWIQGFLPIVNSRNRCQQHLQSIMTARGCLGMILDDDLVWHMEEASFDRILSTLKVRHSDMAFLGLDGDPPIPKEYSRACPVLDALLHLRKVGMLSRATSDRYLVDVEVAAGAPPPFSHHDYYALKKQRFHARPFDFELNAFVHRLYRGQATTRKQQGISEVVDATGRERGGATLVLNPEVLSIPNRSLALGDYVSRRSDMVMALSAYKEGFQMHCTPPALTHVRGESFDSHDPAKLISDVLGVALVESMTRQSDFNQELEARAEETITILSETNRMLALLSRVAGLKPHSLSLIDLMVEESLQTIGRFDSLRCNYSGDLPSVHDQLWQR